MNQKELLVYIVDRFRKIQAFVRLLPFILVAIHLLVMLSYSFLIEDICVILDLLFYVSPLVVIVIFVLSYLCDLCNWHRTECSMVIISPTLAFIDSYIFPFGAFGSDIVLVSQCLIITTSIVSMYFVFRKN